MSDERCDLTKEEALALLPDSGEIHTFANTPGGMLLGADWQRAELVALFQQRPFGRSGPMASRSGHGIAVYLEDGGMLFVETRKEETP